MSKGKKQKRKYLADAVKGAPSAETTKLPPPPHPMIESIVVRDVATYAHEGVAFDNLQLINFIYGGNGCGKTTLSRLLASTEPEKEYPHCEIHWTTKPIQTLVYNKDFRDRNLSENIPGVFTLGEQRVEAMQEMDRMRQEAEASEQMAERLARRMAECEDQKNGQMARLRDRLWQNVFKPNELFKDCLRGYITKGKFTDRLVELKHQHVDDVPQRVLGYRVEDVEELRNRYHKLYDEQEPQPMPLMPMPKEEFQAVMEVAEKPSWGRSIVGSADVPIAALIEKLNIADWVRQGQLNALRRNSEVCPFCQQKTVTKDFRKQLNDFFDQNYLAELQRITDESKRYAGHSARLIATLEEVAAEARMDKEGNRGKWYEVMNADQFTVHVEKLKASLEANHQRMAEKVKNPGMKVEFNDIRTTMMAVWEMLGEANASINAYNDMVTNLVAERERLTADVWRYMVAQAEAEVKRTEDLLARKDKEIKKLAAEKAQAEEKTRQLAEAIKEKEQQITSVQPAINRINNALKKFGFTGFSIKPSPDHKNQYQICRSDGSLASQTLSEGELTFITFLYYMQLVHGSKKSVNLKEPKVLVIDDPISSLDSNVLFVVSQLVRQVVEEVRGGKGDIKQVIVMTHNVYFHKEATFINTRANTDKDTHHYVLFKRGGVSAVEACGRENPIKGSYEMLWKELRQWKDHVADMDNVKLQNVLRRIIEYYFIIFGGHKRNTLFPGNFSKDPEEMAIVTSFARWFDQGSHDIFDDLFVENPRSMNEKYMTVFRQLFVRLGHEAHYKMMMGEN